MKYDRALQDKRPRPSEEHLTGPDGFSKALVTHIKYKTPYQQRDGVLVRQVSGEVVPVREEKEYFRLAGVPWIAPEQRSADALGVSKT